MEQPRARDGEVLLAECDDCGHVFAFTHRDGVPWPNCPACLHVPAPDERKN